ncbi:M48 family metallopeptidase [Enterovirga aerilata]|uniref:M48 family metallopeptidase n=1 Tax=Enterovirga aerilata TaxID=2730920 RepID=A0A849ID81_9HYPH|nr:SprT family zinc-dependent metalloprotease [Enterovirga sp. DB1703]NNM74000.1 M48 family metallopeptidase [Enterovirga sp. DB1703]
MPLLFRRAAPPPEPSTIEVRHAGASFEVALRRRPGVRRLTLRVSNATGQAVLTIPEHATLASARSFAEAHGGWIAARIARVPPRVGFVPGSEVPIRGIPHRIAHRPGLRAVARTERDGAEGALLLVSGLEEAVPGRVRRYLTSEAGKDLRAAVARHTQALGIPARRIAIRDTRSRWGSCSSSGTLSFSWRLIMAPPFVLDYLAAHEVAHLKELNHSNRFWRLLRELCPATEEAESWLRRHGAGLHRYG